MFQLLCILVVPGISHSDLYQSSIDEIWCTAICKFWSHDNIFSHINSSRRTLFQVLKPNRILDLMTFNNFFFLSWQPVSSKTLALLSHLSLLVMKKQRHCWEWNSQLCNPRCNTLPLCHGLFLVACTRLYKPLCPSVGRSVHQLVGRCSQSTQLIVIGLVIFLL